MSYNPRFDIDLKYGEEGEAWVVALGRPGTMEVKRERDMWLDTGNIFFEFQSRGRPSGLKTTESLYWAVVFTKDDGNRGVVVFETQRLKSNLNRLWKDGKLRMVYGGDDGTSRGLLCPMVLIRELMR